MKPEDVKLICSKLCEWAKEGYSILVINHTPKIPPFTPLDLNHCLGSSMLTNFVQSVFAIGTSSKNPSSERYVKQLKMIGYENQMSGTLRQGGEIELYWDFAPYSFGFAEVAADGRNGIVGGLLYHGRPDESFAVVMEPFHGWSIHT